jgi:hypothetical protein
MKLRLCSHARVVGVAFFDFKHGQTGVAPERDRAASDPWLRVSLGLEKAGRLPNAERFPGSRPEIQATTPGRTVEMAERDTKSRGAQKGAIAPGARRHLEAPRLKTRVPDRWRP